MTQHDQDLEQAVHGGHGAGVDDPPIPDKGRAEQNRNHRAPRRATLARLKKRSSVQSKFSAGRKHDAMASGSSRNARKIGEIRADVAFPQVLVLAAG